MKTVLSIVFFSGPVDEGWIDQGVGVLTFRYFLGVGVCVGDMGNIEGVNVNL